MVATKTNLLFLILTLCFFQRGFAQQCGYCNPCYRMFSNKLKAVIIFSISALFSLSYIQAQNSFNNQLPATFSEGIIYSRTTFPGHPLNDSIKSLDFESGDFLQQHNVIQVLKKYQQSIEQNNEQSIKDAFFISGIMVLPIYSKLYFSTEKTFVSTDALGYNHHILIDETSGKLVLSDRNKTNQGTIS
ncbi:MAG: hypothetical protein ACXWCZ_11420, partial [Flavisolibacter sp.]